MKPRWVLIGPPGAGKSTVGAQLAERLGVAYRDTDADIESSAGQSISDIFIEHGEAHFRDLEVQAVAQALHEHDGVLALGGGAVVSAQTRVALEDHNVAFLDVSLAPATKRVGLNAARPLLLGNVRGTLKKLLDERRPLYQSVATITIDTDDRSIAEVVDALAEKGA